MNKIITKKKNLRTILTKKRNLIDKNVIQELNIDAFNELVESIELKNSKEKKYTCLWHRN